jgi:hypothetical protein
MPQQGQLRLPTSKALLQGRHQSGAGKGRLIRRRVLVSRRRDLEPPAGAMALEIAAELEADEVGQPQRPVGETGDHQAVAVEPGPHARP